MNFLSIDFFAGSIWGAVSAFGLSALGRWWHRRKRRAFFAGLNMINKKQIAMVKMAQKAIGMQEVHYRLMLSNVAGVESCTDLDQHGFEDVMAVLEEAAAIGGIDVGSRWRDVVRQRSSWVGPRMIHKIRELYGEYEQHRETGGGNHYELGGLVFKATGRKSRDVSRMTPHQAWKFIEQLKAMVDRVRPAPLPLQEAAVNPDDIPF